MKFTSVPTFYLCPRKYEARFQTITQAYRELFGDVVPQEKQYWSMCALNACDGKISPSSELGQAMTYGLVSASQFYGVDVSHAVIAANRESCSEAHWICSDIIDAVYRYGRMKRLNPAIMNIDTMNMSAGAISLISRSMLALSEYDVHDVMVTGNVMLNNPHGVEWIDEREATLRAEKVYTKLKRDSTLKAAWMYGGWNLHPGCYIYHGTGKHAITVMVTCLAWRR